MEPGEENFFENLATRNAGGHHVDPGRTAGDETDEDERADEGNFEVELAKAKTGAGAIASREAKAPRTKSEWDEEPEGQLTVDVYQTPSDIVVESAIAGVRPEDIDVSVTHDSVSIKGLRYHEHSAGDKDYLYQECYWGRFSRSIILPQEVDSDSAEVTFKNGILTVRLPKKDRKRMKKLRVRTE